MKVFGVMGRNGSGKDEVVDHLRERYGISKISIGDIVREIAEKEGRETTRENLQEIAQAYRQRYGKGYFAKAAVRKIEDRGLETVGITGIRTPADVSVLRDEYGSDLVLVRVRVDDPRLRFQRVRRRNRPRDPDCFPAFLEQDRKEEALFHLSRSLEKADLDIPNNGSLSRLHREIEKRLSPMI